eukprot:2712960-Rhodomonas_salina.1
MAWMVIGDSDCVDDDGDQANGEGGRAIMMVDSMIMMNEEGGQGRQLTNSVVLGCTEAGVRAARASSASPPTATSACHLPTTADPPPLCQVPVSFPCQAVRAPSDCHRHAGAGGWQLEANLKATKAKAQHMPSIHCYLHRCHSRLGRQNVSGYVRLLKRPASRAMHCESRPDLGCSEAGYLSAIFGVILGSSSLVNSVRKGLRRIVGDCAGGGACASP